jgi:hypothetical protein
MVGILFIVIILFIVLQQVYETYNFKEQQNTKNKQKNVQFNDNVKLEYNDKEHNIRRVTRANISEIDLPEGNNNPWTRVLYNPNDDYPYYFYIKIKIPSLNDYESWKQIIPNLNFDPRTGELIIPSKDEPSALALANLIVVNFTGQLSLDNILEKNLIQISVTKAKSHEVVQNKLREQIMDNLQGTNFNITNQPEKELVKQNQSQDEQQQDTIEAYTGTDYAYI